MVARRRVEFQLEREAQMIWATKPEEERMEKIGWFKKVEKQEERDLFIKEYINNNFENRLRNELGLTDFLHLMCSCYNPHCVNQLNEF